MVSFVCAKSKEINKLVCLSSYRTRDNYSLLDSTKIWQACRATSAAPTYFDPVTLGPFGEEFIDGGLGANNPIYALWNQAQGTWGDRMYDMLKCLVSIGTGVPGLKPVGDSVLSIWATMQEIATDTEATALQFHKDKSNLSDEGRYYRFNVDKGLENISLEESKKINEIAAATNYYFQSPVVSQKMEACANILARREC